MRSVDSEKGETDEDVDAKMRKANKVLTQLGKLPVAFHRIRMASYEAQLVQEHYKKCAGLGRKSRHY